MTIVCGAGALSALATAVPAWGTGSGLEADHCGLEDPEIARNAPPVPEKRRPVAERFDRPAVLRAWPGDDGGVAPLGTVGHGAAGGALAGKTVYVSPGHGFVWKTVGWRTQRVNTHDVVEDLAAVEAVSEYLIRYLRNMGAYVVPVKETDPNPNLAVVDDGDEGFFVDGELDIETGPEGFAPVDTPVTGEQNPFRSGSSRVISAAESETGQAVWTFDVPEDGEYNVYIGYVQDPSRAADAHYIVRHAGADTSFRVDQRRHGSTWMLLGRFYFYADSPPHRRQVALANDSSEPGASLSADVARIGGGLNPVDRGGGVSGRPMFESAARYHTQLAGAPPSVYAIRDDDQSADVVSRSRFAAWEHETGEDAIYVAWHTNAPSPGRGTSSYAYAPVPPNGSLDEFTGVPGSLELMDAVHSEILGDLRAVWDPEWSDAGQHTAYFGEINPSHNDEMPAALFELAFHDTAADAESIRDPRFRQIAARAMAQGVARYFAERDGVDLVLPSEPPVAVRTELLDGGRVRLAWDGPEDDPAGGDAPASYRVYLSRDGRAFDNGTRVESTEFDVDPPWQGPVYARVTAVNEGGESLPSAVVGAGPGAGDAQRVLIVDGYERLDRFMALREDLSAFSLGIVDRVVVDRMNNRSYAARHGAALAAAGFSFETASARAVASGDVEPSRYAAMSWFLGEESSGDDPLTAAERDAIAAYLEGGGKLFISGAEIGWSLVEQGDSETIAYYEGVLGATYVQDDAETYRAAGDGALAAVGELGFGDRGPGGFDVDYPDVVEPAAGGEVVMVYEGGTGGAAGVLTGDPAAGQVLILGFPFETVAGADERAELMRHAMAALSVEPSDPGGDAGVGKPPGGGAGGEVASGCGCGAGGSGGAGGIALLVVCALALRRRGPGV